jgi:hypothetical protein
LDAHDSDTIVKRPVAVKLGVALAWSLGAVAHAHQVPSPDANNRYLKVTLLPGAVRIAYTVFFGEAPGAAERRRVDRNGDGRIDDAEAKRFGEDVLAQLAPAEQVIVDGVPSRARWRLTDVGMGTPVVAAGAFSVDVLLEAPYPRPQEGAHELRLEDRWQTPAPGDTELHIEESPGVHIGAAHLTGEPAGPAVLDYLWKGNPRAGDRAVVVTLTVDEDARPPPPKAVAPARRTWPFVVLGLLMVAGVGLVVRARTCKAS